MALPAPEQMGGHVDRIQSAAALRIALKRFEVRSSEIARECGVGTSQRYVLMLLIKASNGDATVGDLARKLYVTQHSMTGLVTRTEDAGLVERETDPEDARSSLLCLTAHGESCLEVAFEELEEERRTLWLAMEQGQGAETPC